MKICFVSQEYPDEISGGIGSYTSSMAKALAICGHEVHVIARTSDKQRVYCDGKVIVHKIMPKLLRNRVLKRYFGNFIYSACVARKIYELIGIYQIEIVEIPEFAAEGFIYSVLPNRLIPLVVRLHTPLKIINKINGNKLSWKGKIFCGILNRMERICILKANAVTSPSHALADLARRELCLEGLEIYVYPNPVDSDFFSPDEENIFNHLASKNVLYAGQLGIRKGVNVFRDIIPKVLKLEPEAKFLFVGADQGYDKNTSMKDYIIQSIPNDQLHKVDFLGKMSWHELRGLYRSSWVCVFPSLFENFPQVCLEAMSCGCLVIGSSSGGMVEIISDEINGFLVQPNDTDGIVERIFHCLNEDLTSMRDSARKSIIESFSLSVVAYHALDVFAKVKFSK